MVTSGRITTDGTTTPQGNIGELDSQMWFSNFYGYVQDMTTLTPTQVSPQISPQDEEQDFQKRFWRNLK